MKNPVTTWTGLAIAVIGILFAYGVLTNEQKIAWEQLAPVLVQIISGLILMFKAGDKEGGF